MNYFSSDIHGHLEAFKKLLKEIEFGKNDNLFVIGGIVDEGPESVELIQDLMIRDNIFPVMGKHEFAMLRFLKAMQKKEEGQTISSAANAAMMKWFSEGGAETAQKLMTLSSDDRDAICDYLEDMEVYLELEIDDKSYICSSAGIRNFDADTDLEDYDYEDYMDGAEEATDIDVAGSILVTGTYPVRDASGLPKGQITVSEGHIKLDCGAGCGGRLGVYCVETGECEYMDV